MPVNLDDFAAVFPVDSQFFRLETEPGHLLLEITVLHLLLRHRADQGRENPKSLVNGLEGSLFFVGGNLQGNGAGGVGTALVLVLLEEESLIDVGFFGLILFCWFVGVGRLKGVFQGGEVVHIVEVVGVADLWGQVGVVVGVVLVIGVMQLGLGGGRSLPIVWSVGLVLLDLLLVSETISHFK